MTKNIEGLETVLDFIKRAEFGVESTGATKVTFTGGLYNVDGSTYDPKKVPHHDGLAWKQLLIAYGIGTGASDKCYVTNTDPAPGGTHPQFVVGGHMTTNSDGQVSKGSTCYLMPLCSWHNSTSKNGIKFGHTLSSMLLLSGYMQGELAATFMLRLPSEDPYAILYHSGEGWNYQNLSEQHVRNLKSELLPRLTAQQNPDFVLFERTRSDTTLHFVREVNLPSAGR